MHIRNIIYDGCTTDIAEASAASCRKVPPYGASEYTRLKQKGIRGSVLLCLLLYFLWKPFMAIAAAPTGGLVGYWSFDEGTGTAAVDTSGIGNNGTLMNMDSSNWIDGRFSKALSFDGVNDYITVGDPAGFLNPNYVTVSAWVNPSNLPSPSQYSQYIVSKDRNCCDTPGQGGYGLGIMSNGRFLGEIWRNSNQTKLSVNGTTPLSPGTWYHVAMTFDGSNVRLYVNGILDAMSATVSNETIQSTTKSLIIGALSYAVPCYCRFNGKIDEVRVYNRALSTDEIAALYTLDDTTPPAAVASLEAMPDSNSSISLTWSIASDDFVVAGYKVLRDGYVIAVVDSPFYTDTDLAVNTEYSYGVVAYDGAGNEAPVSAIVKTRTFQDYSFPETLVAHWEFNENYGSVVYDTTGNGYNGTLTDGPAWTDGKQGTGISFDGINDRIQGMGSIPFEYTGGNMSLSLWYYADSTDTDGGYILSKPWNGTGQYNYYLARNTTNTLTFYLMGATSVSVDTSNALSIDAWNHIAVTISPSEIKLYLNNVLDASTVYSISDWKPSAGNQSISLLFGCIYPYGAGWAGSTTYCVKGKLDNVRIYSDTLATSDVQKIYAAEEPSGDTPSLFISSPAKEYANITGISTLTAEVIGGNVAGVQFMLDGAAIGNEITSPPYTLAWDSTSALNGSHELSAFARTASGKSVTSLVVGITVVNGDGVMVHELPPISSAKVLPNELPIPGKPSLNLSLTAARGEFEPASFAIRSQNIPLSNVSVAVSDLKNGSNTIASSAVDIKTVKAWYQSGMTAWSDIYQDGTFAPNLVPELLLNDDSLVSVDPVNKTNSIKIRSAYVSVSDTTPSALSYYTFDEFPVQDASSFQAFQLPAAFTKQVWLTVHVPEDAPGGTYNGIVTISANGAIVRTLTFMVKVLDFDLRESNIEYSLYYMGRLNASLARIGYDYKNETQMRAELVDLKNHGVKNPTMYQDAGDAYVEPELALRRELGMNGGPLYFLGRIVNAAVPTGTLDAEVPPLLVLVHSYGFTDLYLYGQDEASGQGLLDQRPNWQHAHDLGAKVFVAGSDDSYGLVGDLLDTLVHAGRPRPEYADQWQSVNHKIYNYGNPQAGAEDPFLYRRNYGVSLWAAGYDGVMDFAYQCAFGRPWNDFDDTSYRDHNFTYPTVSGVIGTIAWEGFREAYDDARYLATLEATIASGQASSVLAKQNAAADAIAYLDELRASVLTSGGTGTRTANFPIDLYAMRADIVKHIETILSAND